MSIHDVTRGFVVCASVRAELPSGEVVFATQEDGATLELPAILAPIEYACAHGLPVVGVEVGMGTVRAMWRGLSAEDEAEVLDDAGVTYAAYLGERIVVDGVVVSADTIVGTKVRVGFVAGGSNWGDPTGNVRATIEPGGHVLEYTLDGTQLGQSFVPEAEGPYVATVEWNGMTWVSDPIMVWDVGDAEPRTIRTVNAPGIDTAGPPFEFRLDLPELGACTPLEVWGTWAVPQNGGALAHGNMILPTLSTTPGSGRARIDGLSVCAEEAGTAVLQVSATEYPTTLPLSLGGDAVRAIDLDANLERVAEDTVCGTASATITVEGGRTFEVDANYLSLVAATGVFDPVAVVARYDVPTQYDFCVEASAQFDLVVRFAASEVSVSVASPE